MLGGAIANLRIGIADLISRSERLEHSAWILSDGLLANVTQGDIHGVYASRRPAQNVIGFVHTHPVVDAILAPPSGGDFTLIDFSFNPIQLVAERGGRIWMVFQGGWCSLIGRMSNGAFTASADPSASFVYRIMSSDAYRLEEFHEDEQAARDRRARGAQMQRELAERRRRAAEDLRRQNH